VKEDDALRIALEMDKNSHCTVIRFEYLKSGTVQTGKFAIHARVLDEPVAISDEKDWERVQVELALWERFQSGPSLPMQYAQQ
jgi:hypothetical protein